MSSNKTTTAGVLKDRKMLLRAVGDAFRKLAPGHR